MYTYLFIMQEGGRSLFILLHDLQEEQEVGKRKCHHETSFLDKNNGSWHDEYQPLWTVTLSKDVIIISSPRK